MDWSLTKEQVMIQGSAREFAERQLMPIAAEVDRTGDFPDELYRAMGELGFFGIPFPEEYGGAGADYFCYVLVMEQLARGSGAPCMTVSAHSVGAAAIYLFGTEAQKKRYLPAPLKGQEIASFAFTEPQTGSDPRQITTCARKVGNGYILNGTKRFISNAGYPGPLVVIAREEESGQLTAFIVTKGCEGYSVSKPWEKMGIRGGRLHDVYLRDVRVAEEDVLGPIGAGFPMLLHCMSLGRIGIDALTLGLMQAALEDSIDYVKTKMHRNEPIARFQQIQLRIGEMAARVQASRALLYRLGWLADRISDPREFARESALTKYFVTDAGVAVSRLAVQVHGSYGITRDYRVERLYRDLKIGELVEGVNEMQLIIAAGELLK